MESEIYNRDLKKWKQKSTPYNELTKEHTSQIMQEVEEDEKAEKKTPLQQRRIKWFNVLEIGGGKKLVAQNEGNDNIKCYLSDELYDVIDACLLYTSRCV